MSKKLNKNYVIYGLLLLRRGFSDHCLKREETPDHKNICVSPGPLKLVRLCVFYEEYAQCSCHAKIELNEKLATNNAMLNAHCLFVSKVVE